jgi:uroporphyrinogen decarboxylase
MTGITEQMADKPKLLRVLKSKTEAIPPVWLMRQAGRYLPEYRELRAKADDFLHLCYTPEWAAEITLQPIRRFDFDAAILFADILIVPDALGQKVSFDEGAGPRLEAMMPGELLTKLRPGQAGEKFGIICETVARVREALSPEKALIGFCGAPWTVATYMIAGHGTPDQAPARTAAYRDRENFDRLIDLLAEISTDYLAAQIKAGVHAVQIFDSWAGVLPDEEFERWVIAPTAKMVSLLRERCPGIPVIGFPRGSGAMSGRFIEKTGVDAIGCDTAMPLAQMQALGKSVAVQGNLDPLLLEAGGPLLESRIRDIRGALSGVPHIFNLGHGILKTTPIAHVEQLVRHVRSTV